MAGAFREKVNLRFHFIDALEAGKKLNHLLV
jgi:hypothetical protein